MTDDGLHFTPAAQAIWLDAVDAALRQPGPN
jgi:lysophospholipase L1-like esterase